MEWCLARHARRHGPGLPRYGHRNTRRLENVVFELFHSPSFFAQLFPFLTLFFRHDAVLQADAEHDNVV